MMKAKVQGLNQLKTPGNKNPYMNDTNKELEMTE